MQQIFPVDVLQISYCEHFRNFPKLPIILKFIFDLSRY